MEKMKWIILSTLFLIINISDAWADSIEDEISALMAEYHAIGTSVAVVKDGKIVYAKAFGYKNREKSIPLETTDLFRIASVSKTFLATAVLQLMEKGKLSLDDDVNRYLDFKVRNPNYSDSPITIKMLLCHRSSINDNQGYKAFDKINPDVTSYYAKSYCDYAPDEGYTYCNMNYNILGAVIEKVSGERFDKYIKNHIMKPLQLHGSFNGLELDSVLFVSPYRYRKNQDSLFLIKDVYQPHRQELKNYEMGYSTTVFSPPGGMIISVEDLARYMTMHMYNGKVGQKRILKASSEHSMRKVQTEKTQYALSLMHYKLLIPNEDLIGQTGGKHGIHTAMIFHPEKKYGFIVFCNGCKSKSIDGHEMNFEIIRKLYVLLINHSE